MSAPTRTPRSSWIEEGLRALAAGGPDAVRIEPLARALGVTRGGFYWHFDDRRALLEEILDAWERASVDEVIERVESEGGDARAKLRRLSALAASSDEPLRIDLAVRDWARREQTVAERLRRVDNRRMDYMRSLFGAFCPDEDDVEARCMVFYSLWIGSHFIAADHGARSRADVLKLALRRLEAWQPPRPPTLLTDGLRDWVQARAPTAEATCRTCRTMGAAAVPPNPAPTSIAATATFGSRAGAKATNHASASLGLVEFGRSSAVPVLPATSTPGSRLPCRCPSGRRRASSSAPGGRPSAGWPGWARAARWW